MLCAAEQVFEKGGQIVWSGFDLCLRIAIVRPDERISKVPRMGFERIVRYVEAYCVRYIMMVNCRTVEQFTKRTGAS